MTPEHLGADAAQVVEISAFVAAPFAGMTLAGMGCDVVRVDPPGGGLDFGRWPLTAQGDSLFWAGLNRGKRSVAIDYRLPEGREIVASLVTRPAVGGILLTNLPLSGALSHGELRRRRDDVIALAIEGDRQGRSAVDYTVAARSGIPLLAGPEDFNGPINSPLPSWDVATGLYAALALREAIWRRRAAGIGASIRIALADVAAGALSALGFVDEQRLAARPRSRDGNYLYGAFGRDFKLADGHSIMVVALTLKQWRALVAATGIAEWVSGVEAERSIDLDGEGDRYELRHEIAEQVQRWCDQHDLAEAARLLESQKVCWERYSDAASLSVAPGNVPAGDEPATPGVRAAGDELALRWNGEPPSAYGAPPSLGEHTEAVLADELGMSAAEISRLHDTGIISASTPPTPPALPG